MCRVPWEEDEQHCMTSRGIASVQPLLLCIWWDEVLHSTNKSCFHPYSSLRNKIPVLNCFMQYFYLHNIGPMFYTIIFITKWPCTVSLDFNYSIVSSLWIVILLFLMTTTWEKSFAFCPALYRLHHPRVELSCNLIYLLFSSQLPL